MLDLRKKRKNHHRRLRKETSGLGRNTRENGVTEYKKKGLRKRSWTTVSNSVLGPSKLRAEH